MQLIRQSTVFLAAVEELDPDSSAPGLSLLLLLLLLLQMNTFTRCTCRRYHHKH